MTADQGLSTIRNGDPVCAALSRVLAEGGELHRCHAARALGRIGRKEALEALVAALLDEDADVRTDAASALAQLADPRAAKPLLENLIGDPTADVKLAAIEALTAMRHREVVPWLRRLVNGRDQEIAWDESEYYETGWDDWADVQISAVKALADLGAGEAVPDIVEAIASEHGQDLTEVSFKALARLGEAGVGALIAYLDDSDLRLRRRAAAILAGVDGATARDGVARALADPSGQVRLAVARSLSARNPADERLDCLFDDAEPEIRADVVRLCGRQHPSRLEPLLDDVDVFVREAVLDVLSGMPATPLTDAGADRVRTILGEPEPRTAAAAARALTIVAPADSADDLCHLIADTKRPAAVRLGVLKGLAAIADERATRALAGVLDDDHRPLRLEAMASLAAIAAGDGQGASLASEILLAALRGELVAAPAPMPDHDSDSSTAHEIPARAAEANSQGHAGSDDAAAEEEPAFPTSTLQAIVGDSGPVSDAETIHDDGTELSAEDMERLALAVRQPRKKVVSLDSVIAPHQDVRRFAARVLGDVARPDVAEELAAAISDADREVGLAAVDSLGRIVGRLQDIPETVVDALLAPPSGNDRDMRLAIVRALEQLPPEAIVDVLNSYLSDDDGFVRAEAVRTLAQCAPVGPEISVLLDDPEPGVRLAAAEAVAANGGAGAVDLLVAFAFAFGGLHRREAGGLLRSMDAGSANNQFLATLEDPAQRATWQVAIEALEELNKPAPNKPGPTGEIDAAA